ncbi:MAG: Mu transposase C-terminal domain-containing protein [bacterium]|nr:Mu transposase C-terminal domain-containing protein [bacterium]
MKNIVPGTICKRGGTKCTVQKIVDFKSVIILEHNSRELDLVKLDDLEFTEKSGIDEKYIDSISDEDWKIANRRYSIIKPILDREINSNIEVNKTVLIRELCEEHEVAYTTIYRWLNQYNTTGLVSSLAPAKRSGGRGKSRLTQNVDQIIDETIENFYCVPQRPTKKETALEVIRRCKNAGIEPPHINTIYNRIKHLPKKLALTKRVGYLEVSQKVDATPGSYEEAQNPLDVIQIDHTVLDIIIVNEDNREPIGRPHITLAIDVYSRMVAGLYISFDSPGALGTGICLSNSILPKDQICSKYDLKTEWPIWGIMRNLHFDNAKEFKGTMIKRASEEYGFNINWRPKGKSRYGAHIERLLGTLSKRIHVLPGTTFSDVKYRANYNSEAKATMSLEEFEKWIHIQIVDVYHNQFHTGIGATPLQYYNEGIFGSDRKEGIGLPLMKLNPDKVRLDFLPHIERTIQRTGVVIDHVRYYSDIFRNYLFEKAWNENDRFVKNLRSKKFIFKRDPRDISKIYFFDEKEARYAEIPYADVRRPPMSIWEYRASLKKAKEYFPHSQITEDIIFDAYNRLRDIEESSKDSKKKAKRQSRKKKVKEFNLSVSSSKKEDIREEETIPEIDFNSIEPFDYDDEI